MKKWIVIVSAAFLVGAAGVATLVAQVQQGATRVFIPGDRFRITRELNYEPSLRGAHA